MGSPASRAKTSVDLSGPRRTGSRIRRDPPPPPPRKVAPAELREQEARTIVIGMVILGLALVVLLFELAKVQGWTQNQKPVTIEVPPS